MMEDFSFPTIITDHDPAIFRLPFPTTSAASLWYVHSPEADTAHLRRSFSEGGANIATTCRRALRPSSPAALSDCGSALEYEERMDMLWEDFNEELFRASLDGDLRGGAAPAERRSRRRSVGMEAMAAAAAERPACTSLAEEKELQRGGSAAVELRLVPVLGVATSGPLRQRRKPGLVVMLRMLKKLFVVQKTH
ncbi:hypothetical protein Cni_G27573 [Canna indica]|uniref:Uncharacterized protein n=1 Tax=Canna indica TaxID=4628 RepID=A0AAQ3L5V2_9LILI|nr:hypothetical protein Cni_G27573 [Canna indica]